MSRTRIRAMFRKELREYRRNPSIVWAMAVVPLIFVAPPLAQLLALGAGSAPTLAHKVPLLYMLGIPALVPAVLAAYAIVGERQQGTLEPVLTTPIRHEELLLGKALAVFLPAVAISYFVFGVSVAGVALFAQSAVASAVLRAPELVAQVIFTPLIAAWSIWLAVAVSARSSDPRVAQQLGALASLPTVALSTLVAYGVIRATLEVGLILGAALLVFDLLGWRVVAPMLDRERLISGTRT